MIALIVLGVIVFLLLLICVLPISLDLAYDKHLVFKIKYLGITVFSNKTKKKQKKRKKTEDTVTTNQKTTKKDNIVKKTYKEKGFVGTVKYFSNIITIITKNMWWIIKRFKFKRLKLDLNIATDDAAKTAIFYGEVCTAIYPILSLLKQCIGFNPKEIKINADFDKTKSDFKVSILARAMVIYWLIAGISALSQFLKLQRKESEKNERK